MENPKTLFTKGPWAEMDCEVRDAGGSPICEMLARHEDTEKWGRPHADANSYLICAAPDLFAALMTTLSTLDAVCEMVGFNKYTQHGSKEARNAIAKAIGKSQLKPRGKHNEIL